MLEPKFLDLNSIVRNMEKMLRRLIGEDITFSTALGPTLGSIKADQGQIEQVIINLAVNARDAMPKGGKLRIQTSAVELNRTIREPICTSAGFRTYCLRFPIRALAWTRKAKRVFLSRSLRRKEVGKGTGLGLSTVYGVVRQSGGYIWVYSEPGHGTTLKIYCQARPDRRRNLRNQIARA